MFEGPGTGLYFDSGPGNPAYRSGTNELPVQKLLAKHLRSGDVFYDIGANVGFFSVICARLVGPEGAVYAFEPVTANANYIQKNASRNGIRNVTIIRKAVSDKCGVGSLFLAEYSGGAVLNVAAPPPDLKGTVAVDVVSIDSLVATGTLKPPNVIKIDVEGAELHVLHGMRRTLLSSRPIVILEFDDCSETGLRQKETTCAAFLRTLDYAVERLENSYPNTNWWVSHFMARPTGVHGVVPAGNKRVCREREQ
jgi:FkbM family methyltransferase